MISDTATDLIHGLVERVRERRAQEARVSAPTGMLPGGGISERPSDATPFPMGYGVPGIGPSIVSKPLISAIRDAAVGRGPGAVRLPSAAIGEQPTDGELSPDFAPGIYADLPAWDWEAWDKENILRTPELDVVIDRSGWDVPGYEDDEMAIDWGSVASGAIDIIQGQQVGGGALPSQSYAGLPPTGGLSGMPAKVTVDTRTGQVHACRRRRRRRLLTPTDLSDLAALAAVVGKGDALKLAVAKAVRR